MAVRQQIVDALITVLEGVAPPTYTTDISSTVFEWSGGPFDESQVPACVVRDNDEFLESADDAADLGLFALSVDISVTNIGALSPQQIRTAVDDILTAIGVDVTLGGIAKAVYRENVRLDHTDDAERTVTGATITLRIEYHELQFIT